MSNHDSKKSKTNKLNLQDPYFSCFQLNHVETKVSKNKKFSASRMVRQNNSFRRRHFKLSSRKTSESNKTSENNKTSESNKTKNDTDLSNKDKNDTNLSDKDKNVTADFVNVSNCEYNTKLNSSTNSLSAPSVWEIKTKRTIEKMDLTRVEVTFQTETGNKTYTTDIQNLQTIQQLQQLETESILPNQLNNLCKSKSKSTTSMQSSKRVSFYDDTLTNNNSFTWSQEANCTSTIDNNYSQNTLNTINQSIKQFTNDYLLENKSNVSAISNINNANSNLTIKQSSSQQVAPENKSISDATESYLKTPVAPIIVNYEDIKPKYNNKPIIRHSYLPVSKPITLESLIEKVDRNTELATDQTEITILNSLNNSKIVPNSNENYIIAMVEGRCNASREIGIAILEMSSNKILISQFLDDLLYSRLYVKFNLYFPNRLILTSSSKKNSILKEFLQQCDLKNIEYCERKIFDDTKGLEYLRYYNCFDIVTIQQYVQKKYYCLSALSGLFAYCSKDVSLTLSKGCCSVNYIAADSNMLIDSASSDSLEIVNQLFSRQETLFTLIDRTKTVDGKRILKCNLLEPPCDLDTIIGRQDCVHELISNPNLFHDLNGCFSRIIVKNIKDLMSNLLQKDPSKHTPLNLLNLFINLKLIFQEIPFLQKTLLNFNNSLFKSFAAHLCDQKFIFIEDILDQVLIDKVENQPSLTNFNKCKLIKPECSKPLLTHMQYYEQIATQLSEFQKRMESKYKIKMVRHGTGYSFVSDNKLQIDELIVQPNFRKGKYCYTCYELELFSQRMNQTLNDCFKEVHIVLTSKVYAIRAHLQYLFQLIEILPTIDFLFSLATITLENRWIRPKFGKATTITKGRHPILEKHHSFRANSFHFEKLANGLIITGPNNSGKSVFLRQIALLQILAQIGSFIPAEEATFSIRDRIFARIGSNDDINSNCSSFLKELRQMLFISTNVTTNSLIIIDEMGRGTASEIGGCLCFVLMEQLMLHGCYIALATHFEEPLLLENMYLTTNIYHMKCKEICNNNNIQIETEYQVDRGLSVIDNYGVKFFLKSNLNPAYVKIANKCLKKNKFSLPNLSNTKEEKLLKLNFEYGKIFMRIIQKFEQNQAEKLVRKFHKHYMQHKDIIIKNAEEMEKVQIIEEDEEVEETKQIEPINKLAITEN